MDFQAADPATPVSEVHQPGPHRLWGESWYFDVAADDGSAGAFVRVGDYPHLSQRWSWAYVVDGGTGASRGAAVTGPLDGDRDAPWRTGQGALRLAVEPVPGGWRLRAGGAAFDLDLTWRPTGDRYRYSRGDRLEQPGRATGEIRLDGVVHRLDGPGQRDHSWGLRDWWRLGWTWYAGRLTDGSRFQAAVLDARGRIAPDGYLSTGAGAIEPVTDAAVTATSVRLNRTTFAFTDLAEATVELPSPTGAVATLRRAMARVRTGDGRHGIAWRETNVPPPRGPVR